MESLVINEASSDKHYTLVRIAVNLGICPPVPFGAGILVKAVPVSGNYHGGI